MKFYALITVSLISQSLISQNLQETISYINEKFEYSLLDELQSKKARENSAIVQVSTNTLTKDIQLYDFEEKWEIDKKGELKIKSDIIEYKIPAGTTFPDWLNFRPTKTNNSLKSTFKTLQAKNLNVDIKTEIRSDLNTSETYFLITIFCEGKGECITSSDYKFGKESSHSFKINNSENGKKIVNAIKHLVKLCKENSNFNDPFDY